MKAMGKLAMRNGKPSSFVVRQIIFSIFCSSSVNHKWMPAQQNERQEISNWAHVQTTKQRDEPTNSKEGGSKFLSKKAIAASKRFFPTQHLRATRSRRSMREKNTEQTSIDEYRISKPRSCHIAIDIDPNQLL